MSSNSPAPPKQPNPGFFRGQHKRILVLLVCVGVMGWLFKAMWSASTPETSAPDTNVASVPSPESTFAPLRSLLAPPIAPPAARHADPRPTARPIVRHSPAALAAVLTPAPPVPTPRPATPRPTAAPRPRATLAPSPRIVDLSIKPARIVPGEMASLCVSSIHTHRLLITGSGVARWSFPIACVPVHPMRTATYTVIAIGENGRKVRRSAIVRVIPAPTPSIRALLTPELTPDPNELRRHHAPHDLPTTNESNTPA